MEEGRRKMEEIWKIGYKIWNGMHLIFELSYFVFKHPRS